MIFVVLGTQPFQMNRLLKMVDDLIDQKKIKDDVFAQIGSSDYLPKNYEYKRYLHEEEFEENIFKCSILLTHCGVGTIISGIKNGKPVIVVPRLEKYGEHVDDHQREIGEVFAKKNFVLQLHDGESLESCLKEAKVHHFNTYVSKKEKMYETIFSFLENMELE